MNGNIDESCLIVRNFPPSYTERDIHDFLRMFDALNVSVFLAHRTAVVEFESKDHARDILTLLHQEAVDENRLFVEYAPKNRSHIVTLSTAVNSSISSAQIHHSNDQPSTSMDNENSLDIGDGLKRFYATAENIGINQPPPPHLRYEYPKVNRDIIDAISIALECLPKFYNQVLHLMNRMNLEPPFIPGDKHLIYASSSSNVQYATTSTQTDEAMWQHSMRNKRKLVESDESEMETNSSDADLEKSDNFNILRLKRKKFKLKDTLSDLTKQQLLKQKQRNLIKMHSYQKQLDSIDKPTTNVTKITDAFESQQINVSSIKIVVPEQLDATIKTPTSESLQPMESLNIDEKMVEDADDLTDKTVSDTSLNVWTDAQLKENQIPADQLQVHSIFQNYSPGEISNRLYIKNLSKEVTESDLRAIYNRYLLDNIRTIDIRLMTSGRMKGQAFITFDGPYLNCDVDNENEQNLTYKYRMIEKALHETNGLILKGKPLVVVYGKKNK